MKRDSAQVSEMNSTEEDGDGGRESQPFTSSFVARWHQCLGVWVSVRTGTEGCCWSSGRGDVGGVSEMLITSIMSILGRSSFVR